MKISCWMISEAKIIRQVVVSVVLLIMLVACSDKERMQAVELSGSTMGTRYNITISADSGANPEVSPQVIADALESLENAMSTYRQDSELMQLNRAELNQWLPISPPLFEVLNISRQVSDLSTGAFDITVGPLVNLWGFGPEIKVTDIVPNDDEINQLLEDLGYRQLQLDQESSSVLKNEDVYLDLSAVAKGYAVDVLANILEQHGIHNYLVEIGGEVKIGGLSPRNKPWRIAIELPIFDQGVSQRVIEVSNIAMATSGDYRNYFEENGTRYSHTIDPRNGRPIKHQLASVTVLSDSTAKADALATAFMVLGVDGGLQVANNQDIPAYFLVKAEQGFKEQYSNAFRPFLGE